MPSEKDLQARAQFQPFVIEFNEPQKLRINCVKLLKHDSDNSFKIYRGIETSTSEIFNVYEYRISLERNKIYDKKKLEICETEVKQKNKNF